MIQLPDAIWGANSCGSKEPLLDWSQEMTIPFVATRSAKVAMHPFAKLPWLL